MRPAQLLLTGSDVSQQELTHNLLQNVLIRKKPDFPWFIIVTLYFFLIEATMHGTATES